MDKHQGKSDRDLLIELSTDVKWVKGILDRHLRHHSKMFWVGVSVCSTIATGSVLILIPKLASLV